MTDLKFAILEFIYNTPYHECGEVELFNQRLDDPITVNLALKDLYQSVHDYTTNRDHPPMVIQKPIGTGILKLTSSGNIAYESEKERRNQKAKQDADQRMKEFKTEEDMKKQFRHNFVIAAFSAVSSCLLTLLVEHSKEILDWITALFK